MTISQFYSRMYSSKVGLTFRADDFYEEAMRDSSMKGLDYFERGYRLRDLQLELAKKDLSSKPGIVFPQAQHLLDSSHAAHLEHYKSGMRSPRTADTLQAMQILLAEKRRK